MKRLGTDCHASRPVPCIWVTTTCLEMADHVSLALQNVVNLTDDTFETAVCG
jgi:hypothetical protein